MHAMGTDKTRTEDTVVYEDFLKQKVLPGLGTTEGYCGGTRARRPGSWRSKACTVPGVVGA